MDVGAPLARSSAVPRVPARLAMRAVRAGRNRRALEPAPDAARVAPPHPRLLPRRVHVRRARPLAARERLTARPWGELPLPASSLPAPDRSCLALGRRRASVPHDPGRQRGDDVAGGGAGLPARAPAPHRRPAGAGDGRCRGAAAGAPLFLLAAGRDARVPARARGSSRQRSPRSSGRRFDTSSPCWPSPGLRRRRGSSWRSCRSATSLRSSPSACATGACARRSASTQLQPARSHWRSWPGSVRRSSGTVGIYGDVTAYSVDLRVAVRGFGANALVLAYAAGWVLVPGALIGLALALVRPRSRAELGFGVFAVAELALLLVQASVVGDAGRVQERYAMYALPLVVVAFALYASRGWPHLRAYALLAAVAATSAAVVPLAGYAADGERPVGRARRAAPPRSPTRRRRPRLAHDRARRVGPLGGSSRRGLLAPSARDPGRAHRYGPRWRWRRPAQRSPTSTTLEARCGRASSRPTHPGSTPQRTSP